MLEREKGRGKAREKDINVREKHQLFTFCAHLNWGPNLHLGTCPEWESNLHPFSLWDDAQPTEPH